jgi:hypothetical protein
MKDQSFNLVSDDSNSGVKFRFWDLRFDAPNVARDVVRVDVSHQTASAIAIVVVVTPST